MSIYPSFFWLDDFFLGLFPPAVAVILWATMGATLSMTIYALAGPQQKLKELKAEYKAAQKELIGYDGDFAGQQVIVRKVMALSLKRLGLTLGPTLLALPFFIYPLLWVDYAYSFDFPPKGEKITVTVAPHDIFVVGPHYAPSTDTPTWSIPWPGPGEAIFYKSRNKLRSSKLYFSRAVGHMYDGGWWGLIDPAAVAPDGIDEISFDLPRRDLTGYGPEWLRGWEGIFFGVFIMVSVTLKFTLRIE